MLLATAAQADRRTRGVGAGDDDKLKLRQLENVVDEMAIAAGLPRPHVYVVPDADPNAFATGRGPEHSSIAVTRGLLDTLDREELQGVVAHEMSHIRNLDIRRDDDRGGARRRDGAAGRLGAAGDDVGRRLARGAGDDGAGAARPGIVFFAVWLVAILLAPLVAQMLAMMVSRRREYLADASGAELTRNPIGLARALEKIETASRRRRAAINRGIGAPVHRRSARAGTMNLREGFWADLFASHPPMAARIAALKAMAYQQERSRAAMESTQSDIGMIRPVCTGRTCSGGGPWLSAQPTPTAGTDPRILRRVERGRGSRASASSRRRRRRRRPRPTST